MIKTYFSKLGYKNASLSNVLGVDFILEPQWLDAKIKSIFKLDCVSMMKLCFVKVFLNQTSPNIF